MKASQALHGEATRENVPYEIRMRRARHLAAKHGLVIRSSRTRTGMHPDFGACWLQNATYGFIECGDPVYSRLDDLENALAEMEAAA